MSTIFSADFSAARLLYSTQIGRVALCVGVFFTLLDDLYEDLHGTDEDGREGLDLLSGAGEGVPVHLVREVVCPLRNR